MGRTPFTRPGCSLFYFVRFMHFLLGSANADPCVCRARYKSRCHPCNFWVEFSVTFLKKSPFYEFYRVLAYQSKHKLNNFVSNLGEICTILHSQLLTTLSTKAVSFAVKILLVNIKLTHMYI